MSQPLNTNDSEIPLIKQLLFGSILRTFEVHNLDVLPGTDVVEDGEDLETAFEKQWEFIEPKLNALIASKELKAQIKILRSLPDVRLGGDDAQWFEDHLWKEIEKLELKLKQGNSND